MKITNHCRKRFNKFFQSSLPGKSFRNQAKEIWNEKLSSVSVTLEYAFDDWCLAQMARALGKTDDYKLFLKWDQHPINNGEAMLKMHLRR